ncbi:unnamed protein product [Rhizoctonia solani]|uniref:DyP dimeric alpha+beta barrel domain-containing protein n=1 Tax=Rhizoctonia solani TaxID=456999 RepID=A0A8H2XY36_9AGAM|nr:unnamed protein product [Rhizoctonia solani]
MHTLTNDDYKDIQKHEEDKRLLKLLRTRGQVPLIPESDSHNVPRLDNVQGDVLFRFPKTYERFIFFRIHNDKCKQFISALSKFKPTTANDVKDFMLDICRKKQVAKLKEKARLKDEEAAKLENEAGPGGLEGEAKAKAAKLKEEAVNLRKEAIRVGGKNIPDDDEKGQVRPERIPLKQQMIAFTRAGLNTLGQTDKTGDDRFDLNNMLDDRIELGDQSDWDLLFDWKEEGGEKDSLGRTENKNRKPSKNANPLHGVVIIATENEKERDEATREANELFKDCWTVPENTGILDGNVRGGNKRGHEHFGFLDGISQPAIRDIEHPLPGQLQVDPGVIVIGYSGDPVPRSKRADWTKDGTMMVFRKLEQSVIEFEQYCEDNGSRWEEFVPGGKSAVEHMGFDKKDGAELFAARLVGRWKSGAPLTLTPFRDDLELAADPKRNNDFDYAVTGVPGISAREPSDYYCPFTAHARKTVPRNLDPYISRQYLSSSAIVRAAIPYGPEVDDEEKKKWAEEKKKKVEDNQKFNKFQLDPKDRGLLFNCYASHLDSGFVRQTTGFGNNDFFPITSLTPTNHGQDPIIGGPPAQGSSNELRRVLEISEPIIPPRPYRADASTEDASTQVAKGYKATNGQQVNLRLEPKDSVASKDVLEVTGFVKAAPAGKPRPGADNPFFVTSRGGEYFFVPSISALRLFTKDDKTTGLPVEK